VSSEVGQLGEKNLEYLKFWLANSEGSQWQMSHISRFEGFAWSVG
jgi:hypothetical protein